MSAQSFAAPSSEEGVMFGSSAFLFLSQCSIPTHYSTDPKGTVLESILFLIIPCEKSGYLERRLEVVL